MLIHSPLNAKLFFVPLNLQRCLHAGSAILYHTGKPFSKVYALPLELRTPPGANRQLQSAGKR